VLKERINRSVSRRENSISPSCDQSSIQQRLAEYVEIAAAGSK